MKIIYEQILKLSAAAVLSGLIGWEREKSRKPAGLRTHMLVCAGIGWHISAIATTILIVIISFPGKLKKSGK